MDQIEPESDALTTGDDSLYLYVNNDIKYRLFEDIVDSYYLDSQIKDDFQCDQDCYSQYRDPTNDDHLENLYIHKTKTLDATPVKSKCGIPPKPKPEIPSSKTRSLTAAKASTT